MKKIGCLLLAAVLLLFAACGGTPAQDASGVSVPPPPTNDGMLADLYTALVGGDGTQFIVDIFGASPQSGKRVQITKELFTTIAAALCVDEAERVEEPVAVTAWDDRDEIMIQGWGQGQARVVAQLFRLDAQITEPAVDKTMLQLQVGTETAVYYYEQSVFDTVHAAISASYVPDALVLKGDYVALKPSPDVSSGASVGTPVEVGGQLALLYTWASGVGNTSALVLYDPATGAYEYSATIGNNAETLEAVSYGEYDLRVRFKNGSMLYLNSQDLEQTDTEELPEPLMDQLEAVQREGLSNIRGYDLYPGGQAAVVCGRLGAMLWHEGETTSLLNVDIPAQLVAGHVSSQPTDPAEYVPVFTEPRLLNGGNTLVCLIDLPGAQYSRNGLLLYDIPTGQTYWHTNLFGELAQVAYLNDTTVVAATGDKLYRFDLTDYSRQETEHPLLQEHGSILYEATTADYEQFVFSHLERQADGSLMTSWHTGDADAPILTVQSGLYGFYQAGITPHYIIGRGMNEGNMELVVVKYR